MTNYATITRNPINSKVRRVLYTLLTFVGVLFIMGTILGVAGYSDTHYKTVAEVYSIEDNSILLVDGAGYVWEVTDKPELHKGDMVEVKFFNNCSDYTREDDEIIKIKLLDN